MSILPVAKSVRPGPLHRRSTLKRSFDDTKFMDTPNSPTKRTRVTFDSDVEIVSADDEEDVDPQVLKELVRRAIERHRAGDNEPYERYSALFASDLSKPNAPSMKTLRIHLQALLSNVANLTKDCTSLVDAVIHSDWIAGDDAYYTLAVRFLSNLIAAQKGFQNKVVHMLVNLLGPQKTRRILDHKPIRQPKIHKRTFQAIRHITLNIPGTSGSLADRISARLHFEFEKAEERMTYVRNFMQLIEYVPELSSSILHVVLQELIKLDVLVQDSLDDEDDMEEELLQHMSSSQTLLYRSSQTLAEISSDDEDDITSSEESDLEDNADKTAEEVQQQKIREIVRQVDQIMEMLFEYYDKLITTGSPDVRSNAIAQLKNQFFANILPTYGSRHPQFLMFHFAQADEITIDDFIASCIERVASKRHNPIIRHSAAAYFAGFVGRGAHVHKDLVQSCTELLCDQVNVLREKYDPESMTAVRRKRKEREADRQLQACYGPDIRKYGDFYAMFQALVYIFCFRWRDLASTRSDPDAEDDEVDGTEHTDYRFEERLTETLTMAMDSKLNPLRVCTPIIVDQFAKLTAALGLFFLPPKIESNKQVRVATHWRGLSDLNINQPDRDQSWIGDNGMIEGYFPFDPYHLPISRHWIQDDYLDWTGVPGEEAASDSEDDGMQLIDDVTDEEI
ncbi:RNA polymerase I-specific transcription initiation factor rrn3 [Cyphellophora attinorum]|uniref:RNA polymerase I-specific transcription initiation factor rrn3 n=1 Tax=Cyphellophora attinorum TaxID=1664694 RepID=A0A0N1HRV8_9EURO|nr:RNA polymerase I-specific transcription initiation factor rrn3 [Phialophora attinorum]KPI38674.1 RNA polymerase I-specific transcription initiation factor rrn3 [Phialophora attinorum]